MPIFLDVGGHDRSDDDVFGEVALQLSDGLLPVAGRLFADQLNVKKSALVWTKCVSRGHSADNTRRDVGHHVLKNIKECVDWLFECCFAAVARCIRDTDRIEVCSSQEKSKQETNIKKQNNDCVLFSLPYRGHKFWSMQSPSLAQKLV